MGNTAAAGIRHGITADRAFIAGDIQHFDHIRVILVAAHSHFDPLDYDGALFVNAAPHCRFFAGDDLQRDLIIAAFQIILPCPLCDRTQYLVF